MEIPPEPTPRVARGVLGDGWVGRLAEAAEPWLLERLRVVAQTPVEQVHLGWGEEAAREVVVNWGTPTAVADPFVAVAGRIVPARSERIPGGGWAHRARVAPLDPDTRFTYSVGHAGRARSRPSRFRTAPVGPAAFVFTASDDHGTDRPRAGALPRFAARRTVELVEELEPAFHLVAGDLSYANGDASVWDRWFRMIEPSARSRPWMGCVGNQDGAYARRLPLAHAESSVVERTFGTFRYAGLRFILLDNTDVSSRSTANRGNTGGVQARWLERTLEHAAADAAVEAVVVVMHQPALSSTTTHGSDRGIRETWHGTFADHGVSLVLQGHDRIDERTHPSAGGAEEPVVTESGVTYLTCGNAGFARISAETGVVRVTVEPATTVRPTRLTVTRHPAQGNGSPVDVATLVGRRTRPRAAWAHPKVPSETVDGLDLDVPLQGASEAIERGP